MDSFFRFGILPLKCLGGGPHCRRMNNQLKNKEKALICDFFEIFRKLALLVKRSVGNRIPWIVRKGKKSEKCK